MLLTVFILFMLLLASALIFKITECHREFSAVGSTLADKVFASLEALLCLYGLYIIFFNIGLPD